MSESAELLLLSDPQAFMDVVHEHNIEQRMKSLHTLDDIVTCEVLRHGIFNDQAALPGLVEFYSQVFLPEPVDRRRAVYRHVSMIVPQLGSETAGAFTPFMMLDPDAGIVSTATIDYASIGALIASDPLTRPKDALQMVESKIPENPAAVIGGLFALGDARVCNIIAPIAKQMAAEDIEIVTSCFSGFTAKAIAEFYLGWIEEIIDPQDAEQEKILGHLVAGLYRFAKADSIPFIVDGFRPFPVPQGENAIWPDITQIDRNEYAASISERLYELERKENDPKILPHVINAFGLDGKEGDGIIKPILQ